MAKIETIRDLVTAQTKGIHPESQATAFTALRSRPRIQNVASEFLSTDRISLPSQNTATNFSRTPSSIRKQIETQNDFTNPESMFATPTLLKRLDRNPKAKVEVAQAHSTMSKATVKATYIQEEVETGVKTSPKELIQKTRKATGFSRTPRTIANLIK